MAIASMCMTLGFGIGFVMVTRSMVKNLELRVDRINGTPERVIVIEHKVDSIERAVDRIWNHIEASKQSEGR